MVKPPRKNSGCYHEHKVKARSHHRSEHQIYWRRSYATNGNRQNGSKGERTRKSTYQRKYENYSPKNERGSLSKNSKPRKEENRGDRNELRGPNSSSGSSRATRKSPAIEQKTGGCPERKEHKALTDLETYRNDNSDQKSSPKCSSLNPAPENQKQSDHNISTSLWFPQLEWFQLCQRFPKLRRFPPYYHLHPSVDFGYPFVPCFNPYCFPRPRWPYPRYFERFGHNYDGCHEFRSQAFY